MYTPYIHTPIRSDGARAHLDNKRKQKSVRARARHAARTNLTSKTQNAPSLWASP